MKNYRTAARKYLLFGVISAGLLLVFPTVVAIAIVFFMPMENKQQEDAVEFYAFLSWVILTLVLLFSTLGFLLSSLMAQVRYRRAQRRLACPDHRAPTFFAENR